MTRVVAAFTGIAGAGVALMVSAPALHAQADDRARVAAGVFKLLDVNNDGALTRDETRTTFDGWYTKWKAPDAAGLSGEALMGGLSQVLPGAPCGGRSATPRIACPADVTAMMHALPAVAPVKPKQARKVLVLAHAAGYQHSSIPLAARTIEELGKKTGAWSTTITYDPVDINEQNLKQYDAIFLPSTTGHFLDNPTDAGATAARRKALLDFVRGGKGLAAIHAATDSYHASAKDLKAAATTGVDPMVARLASLGPGLESAYPMSSRLVADGDANGDRVLSKEELAAVAGAWFDKVDTGKGGRVT